MKLITNSFFLLMVLISFKNNTSELTKALTSNDFSAVQRILTDIQHYKGAISYVWDHITKRIRTPQGKKAILTGMCLGAGLTASTLCHTGGNSEITHSTFKCKDFEFDQGFPSCTEPHEDVFLELISWGSQFIAGPEAAHVISSVNQAFKAECLNNQRKYIRVYEQAEAQHEEDCKKAKAEFNKQPINIIWNHSPLISCMGIIGASLPLIVPSLCKLRKAKNRKKSLTDRDDFGRTPLGLAIELKDEKKAIETVNQLLTFRQIQNQIKRDINGEPSIRIKGEYPIHIAARTGRQLIVERLLHLGIPADMRTIQEGYTPLHLAVIRGHFSVIHLLASYPGIDHSDHFGKTALYYAIEKNDSESVNALLHPGSGNGADPNIPSLHLTPLQQATSKGKDFTEIAELLRTSLQRYHNPSISAYSEH